MKRMKSKWSVLLFAVTAVFIACPTVVLAEAPKPAVYATFWALVPPVVAIVLALITKEVYSSLFVGILVGALFYSGGNFEKTMTHIFEGGIIGVLSDSYNVGILVFLVILGAMVCLMNRAGGSAAFGRWAGKHIKTRVGAELATVLLGVLIFIDDYFNCLTVGSVMRPVTDKHNVSRAKLAYLIDATAAPVCIIAPISSWAAAVSGFVEGEDGLSIFVRAIPYNFYALLTIVMMVGMILMKTEFGSMGIHESNALKGDIYTTASRPYANDEDNGEGNPRGKVIDLLIPILSLVVCCVIGMIYTGGFFEGTDFVTAFSQSDASVGLAMGSFFGLLITILLYMVRRVMTFRDCMSCIPDGFKSMVPAILILTFAWTLKSMTDSCCECHAVCSGRIYEFPACSDFPCWLRSCLCNRNFMGNFWHSDSDCCCGIFWHKRRSYDHFHFCMYGRRRMRRPLFSDLGYYDHGFCGSPVRPCKSCVHTASLCAGSCGSIFCLLHYSRLCTVCMDCASGCFSAYDDCTVYY